MSIHITLLSSKGDVEQCFLMAESIGYAVINTACTKSVAGDEWLEEYKVSLTEQARNQVSKSQRKSKSAYRFGDGVEKSSFMTS